jgi:hypothetical protein
MGDIDDKKWLLQKDTDPSHGIRICSLAEEYKAAIGKQNLSYPARSPVLKMKHG